MVGIIPILSGFTSGYLSWITSDTFNNQVWKRVTRTALATGATVLCSIKWECFGAITSLVTVSTWSYLAIYNTSSGRVIFCPSDSQEPVRKRLALSIENIVVRTPGLFQPRYIPTFWAADKWTNIALFITKQMFDKSFLRGNKIRRDILVMTDGGTVSIDFADDEHLPSSAPFVIFLHTITGSSHETGHYLRYATRRGWRSCVFNRRGHGGVKLSSPNFNVMGEARDTAAQVDFVKKKYPELSFLAMVGISAGSGLLITYLGKEGNRTPVQAACSLCPAYDVTKAFSMLAIHYSAVDRYILGSMKRLFIKSNEEILGTLSLSSLLDCSNASTIHEFFCAHYPFSGCETLEQYFRENNPMEWVDRVVRPVLIVNSEDDMVCLPENIREDIIRSLGGALLLRTRRGSHIAFNEGIFGTGCYLSRTSMDFLDSARLLHLEEQRSQS